MTLKIAVIRQERPKAVQVIVGEYPYRIWWVPRSLIKDGAFLQAGERDIEVEIPEWFVKKSSEEVASDITLLSKA